MRLLFLFLVTISVYLTSCNSPGKVEFPNNEVFIDVRTVEQFESGHIQNALHIPYNEISQKIAQQVPDKNTKIILYCKSGGRAGKALTSLNLLGYKNVVNAGGYQNLMEQKKVEISK